MNSGTRIPLACPIGERYFSTIDECIPDAITLLPDFPRAFVLNKTCEGRLVASQSQLDSLRFCIIINGSLTLAVGDVSADFSALHDITAIEGLFSFVQCPTPTRARFTCHTELQYD